MKLDERRVWRTEQDAGFEPPDRQELADLARSQALIADQKRMSSKSAEDVIRGRRDPLRQAGGLAAAC